MTKIDDRTGLPELPKGYFWRVTRGFCSEYVEVQIRKRVLFVFSRTVTYSTQNKARLNPYSLRSTAIHALRDFNPESDWKKYVGDYPPKKLEN